MLLLLLLSSLLPPSLALDTLVVHQSDILKIKCDQLNMRSIYSEGTCYYTHGDRFTSAEGLQMCQGVFRDATLFTDNSPILEKMFEKPHEFHDSDTSSEKKRALCAYELGSKCEDDETLLVNSYCLHISDDEKNYNDGLKFCRSRGASFPSVENVHQNLLIAGEMQSKRVRAGWLLQRTVKSGAALKWTFPESNETISYFAPLGGSAATCRVEEGMLIQGQSRQCSSFGTWTFNDLAKRNKTLCIRTADSDFNPIVKGPTVPTNPGTNPTGHPSNDILIPLKYFYNAWHIRHAFCTNAACMHYTNKKDVGFSPTFKKAGSLGRVITYYSNGMEKMKTLCPDGVGKLVTLYFRKEGKRYVADFTKGQVGVQGYVAREPGVCGANVGIKEYSCSKSADFMYGQSLEWNTWYRGRVRHGNKPLFWIWK